MPDNSLPPQATVPEGWLKPLTLAQWYALPEPDVRWIVKGAIPVESLQMISGPRKRTYKTYTAMLFAALAVSGGTYEHYKRWQAETAVNVLFLEQESTQHDNRRRFQNIMQGMGHLRDRAEFPGQMLWALRSQFKLDNPVMVRDVIKLMQLEGVKLLILDALTFMQAGDPNSTRDAALVAQALQDIRAKTGASVLWIMHTNKEGESLDRDPDLDVRNSSVLLDVYDGHMAIRRKKKRVLTTTMRFRESPEYEVEMFWNLPPAGTNDSPAIGPAWVDVVELGADKQTGDAVQRLRDAGWVPGMIYPASAFRTVMGLASGPAAELRARLIAEKRLVAGPDGTGCGLPEEKKP